MIIIKYLILGLLVIIIIRFNALGFDDYHVDNSDINMLPFFSN